MFLIKSNEDNTNIISTQINGISKIANKNSNIYKI